MGIARTPCSFAPASQVEAGALLAALGVTAAQRRLCFPEAPAGTSSTVTSQRGTSAGPLTTAVNTSFSAPLKAHVSSSHGEPVEDGQVTFFVPAAGAKRHAQP